VFRQIKWLVVMMLFFPLLAAGAGPDLVLKDLDGNDRNVNEFIGQGKWVVVVIWSADCPICKREIYHMTFFHDEHKKKDAVVLGMSIDGYANKKKVLGFIDDQGLNFPNLIGDPDTASRFGAGMFIGTPTYYFFSPEGRIMARRIGPVTQEQVENLINTLNAQREKNQRQG